MKILSGQELASVIWWGVAQRVGAVEDDVAGVNVNVLLERGRDTALRQVSISGEHHITIHITEVMHLATTDDEREH